MIKVSANRCNVKIHEVSGSGIDIISELCCIVVAICQGWCSDEEDSEGMKKSMIDYVAKTLLENEEFLNGKKVD